MANELPHPAGLARVQVLESVFNALLPRFDVARVVAYDPSGRELIGWNLRPAEALPVTPAPATTVPSESPDRKDDETTEAVLDLLRVARGGTTAPDLLTALAALGHTLDRRTVERRLAALMDAGRIDNTKGSGSPGYVLLPEPS